MGNFVIIEDYRDRETKTDLPTIALDDKELVHGLKALGVIPLFTETNGTKLRVHFEKEKCQSAYVLIQKALVGVFPSQDEMLKARLEFIVNYVRSEAGWRHSLSMMRNYKSGD